MTPNAHGVSTGPRFSEFPLLADWRVTFDRDVFTPAQRLSTVRQVATLLDGIYVHLWQKRAMYGIEPLQRLRALERRLPELTDAQFQAELQRAVVELRDLHTNYVLPVPYRNFASLGILIERYWDGDTPHWIVSKLRDDLEIGGTPLVVGAEVRHWNGSPIATAVARVAEMEAGSNQAARLARGLENMTQRSFATSPVPDEDWVDLEYRVDGATHNTLLPWRVVTAAVLLDKDEEEHVLRVGDIDLRTELIQRLKTALFATRAVAEEQGASQKDTPSSTAQRQADSGAIDTKRKHELGARVVTTAHGRFGHLRIYTFQPADYPDVDDVKDFLKEVARLRPPEVGFRLLFKLIMV